MLLHLPHVLTPVELLSVSATLRQADTPWVDGRITAGYQGAAVKSNQQLDESSATARELGGVVLASLERNALFISAALPNRIYPPMFNRYGEGMHFGNHVDGSIRMLGQSQKLRADLSATLFLTPKETYEGGELVVENDFGSQRIKLDAGDMIVYGAASRHRVDPIVSGERTAAVFWIQSLVRSDAQRLQLFELDRTIQRLVELETDPDSMVRLTSLYHGLMRLWADT